MKIIKWDGNQIIVLLFIKALKPMLSKVKSKLRSKSNIGN